MYLYQSKSNKSLVLLSAKELPKSHASQYDMVLSSEKSEFLAPVAKKMKAIPFYSIQDDLDEIRLLVSICAIIKREHKPKIDLSQQDNK